MAAVLRLFRLGHQSLWIDEMETWWAADVGHPLALRDLLDNVHGPLYCAAVHLSTRLAGDHEWSMRLPSAIAGVLAVPAFAALARRWLGARAVAPAAWLAAGSPFLVWYAQEARNYAWLVLFVCLSTTALLELQRRCDAGGVLRYVGSAAAGLLSNLSFVLALPFHLRLGLASGPTRAARLRAAAIVAAAMALVALPWVPIVSRIWDWRRLVAPATAAETPLRGATTFHVAGVPFAFHVFAMGYTAGPSLRELHADPSLRTLARHAPELAASAAVFAALAALGLAALARRRRLWDLGVWIVAPTLVVSYLAARNFKVFNPRYLAIGLPGVLLVFAAAFADAGRRTRLALGVAVAALWAVSLFHLEFDPAYQREDYRGALAAVRAGFAPGEQVLAVGSPDPVEYYARGLPVSRWWLGLVDRPARMQETLDAAFARARGTWVVLSRSEDLDPNGRLARWLDARVPPAGRVARPGVRVWHVTGAGAAPAR